MEETGWCLMQAKEEDKATAEDEEDVNYVRVICQHLE